MLYLVPSRGRPHNAERLITAFYETKYFDDTELMFCLDDDDPTLEQYVEVLTDKAYDDAGWLGYNVAPRMRLGPTLNHYAVRYAPWRNAIGFMGDDHRPMSVHWDRAIHDALSLKPRIVYGNDLVQSENLPTAVMMTSDIIRALGQMVPQTLTHLFLDNYWRDLGKGADCLTYLPGVIIQHLHPGAGTAEHDERYAEVNSPAMWTADEAAWHDYVAELKLAADIRAILPLRSA